MYNSIQMGYVKWHFGQMSVCVHSYVCDMAFNAVDALSCAKLRTIHVQIYLYMQYTQYIYICVWIN